MFDNLPKEVVWYSMIPFLAIIVIDVLLFILIYINKKKSDDNVNVQVKFVNYNILIKLSMILAVSLVLPVICGFTWWIVENYWHREILFDNLLYIGLMVFLSLCLLVLVIWIYLKILEKLDRNIARNHEA